MPEPPADPEWRRFRWDAITRLVDRLYSGVHGQGPAVTAAVFPTPEIARALVRQDWTRWRMDGVMPMIYHGFYEQPVSWFGAAAQGVAALGGRAPLYAGLYLADLPPGALAMGVGRALDAGAAGVVLFDHGAATDAHWSAVRGALEART